MANYVEVANLEQLPPGRGTVVTIERKDIALSNVDGTIYAMDDGCLHHGLSLGTSQLDGKSPPGARSVLLDTGSLLTR
jgi:3-phenylpropionate/trans-cinnamate dioxygenase ferredoxin subunit